MAKRRPNRRGRAGDDQRRGSSPPAGVGRPMRLDDLLLPPGPLPPTGATAPAPAPDPFFATLPAHSEIKDAKKPEEREESRLEAVADVGPDGPHVRLGAAW